MPPRICGGQRVTPGIGLLSTLLEAGSLVQQARLARPRASDTPTSASYITVGVLGLQTCPPVSGFTWVLGDSNSDLGACWILYSLSPRPRPRPLVLE